MTHYLKILLSILSNIDGHFKYILIPSAFAFSARLISTFSNILFSLIVARIYGPETIGIVALINSFLIISTIFSSFGTPTSIVRFIPDHLHNYSPASALSIYHKCLLLVIIASILFSIAIYHISYFIAIGIFSKMYYYPIIKLSSFFIIFKSLTLLTTNAIRSLNSVKWYLIATILPSSFNLIIFITIYYLFNFKLTPIYSVLFSYFISAIIGLIIVEKQFNTLWQPISNIKHMSYSSLFSISIPMLLAEAMNYVISQTGIIALGIFRSDKEIGLYSIAVRLASLSVFVLHAVNTFVAPKFSYLFSKGDFINLFHIAKRSAMLIFLANFPLFILYLAAGDLILIKFFGNNFIDAFPPLIVLSVGHLFNSISGSTGPFLNMTGNHKIFRNIMSFTAIFNLVMCVWLSNLFGVIGASISAALSLILWNSSALYFTKLKYNKTTAYIPFITKN